LDIPNHIAPFWQSFVRSRAEGPTPRLFEAFHFDDNEKSANHLARLVLAGTKRATATLAWSFEAKSAPMPGVGALSVVTDFARTPLCVIETRRVDVVAYDAVSEEFAAIEGEGDGSLRYWREAHWVYFGRECARIGRERDSRMPVVCERFEVVFPSRP